MEIPGFTIIEKITENSRIESWLARQINLDRLVVVKKLKARYAADQAEIRAFIDPARSVARLKHPNIVQIYDVAEEHDNHYVILEHVNGRSVAEIVEQEGPMTEKQALHIIQQVADALNSAWTVGHIVHRNIKPENIILDRNKHVKVADMGLAKVAGKPDGGSDDDIIQGTPNYMAPEQIYDTAKIDFRTDMYGLGTSLFHMLSGEAPFNDLPPMEILNQQKSGHLPDPRKFNPKLSSGIVLLLHRLLMKEPEDRYVTWKDACADIKALAAGRTGAVRAPLQGASTLEVRKAATAKSSKAGKKGKTGSGGGLLSMIKGPSLLFRFAAWLALWAWLIVFFCMKMDVDFKLMYTDPADVSTAETAEIEDDEDSEAPARVVEVPETDEEVAEPEVPRVAVDDDPLHPIKLQLARFLLDRHNTRAVARMNEIMARVPENHPHRAECENMKQIINNVARMNDIIADGFRNMVGSETRMVINGRPQRVMVSAVAGNRITVTPISDDDDGNDPSAPSVVLSVEQLAPLDKLRRIREFDDRHSAAAMALVLYMSEGQTPRARAIADECGPLANAFSELLAE